MPILWKCFGQSGCQGQSGVPGPVWGARASLGCQGRSGTPEPIWNASASLPGQGQSEVLRSIWDANANHLIEYFTINLGLVNMNKIKDYAKMNKKATKKAKIKNVITKINQIKSNIKD